jgi:hypothetical protein
MSSSDVSTTLLNVLEASPLGSAVTASSAEGASSASSFQPSPFLCKLYERSEFNKFAEQKKIPYLTFRLGRGCFFMLRGVRLRA